MKNKLSIDNLIDILKYVNYKKVTFMLENFHQSELIHLIQFEELVNYNDIMNLPYSDNFKNIELTSYDRNIPFKKI